MALEPIIDEDGYASEEDSDFAPAGAAAESASGSESELESESEATADRPVGAIPKRKQVDADTVEGDLENSGDETIIRKGQKRQKKVKQARGGTEEDDAGEGGLIKTRRQRALEKADRKSLAVTGPVTIDVDDLWAQMTAVPLIPQRNATILDDNQQLGQGDASDDAATATTTLRNSNGIDPLEMVKIRRTYNFAGKVHTEEKLVARDSAEAKLYLASQDPKLAGAEDENEQLKRNPRKAFRSTFEPAIEAFSQRADLKLGMNIRLELREQQAKAKKLNVVEKSRMDWAGFVDKEGIKDELELAGKSKESYVNRQDFLQRVEAKKEEEAKRARIAGRG
ncbi:bucentaur or craniofacial development-domain-containing protein [Xylaria bambusicola]|uniref:bucentaur or craniofacial development-domain-containing protein n=1 Tax=Xylaria bambusicola TaxID=326684 RepID=UPI002007B3C8|nr:bucentaur or craniofacial development-domain-containing protein [Xylaria bambusicola]KAI0526540.1 bucentaur or craniofacial development-domain-containing protein [Xylaria bambusicola]